MALSLGDIAIGAEGLYLGDILIGADNMTLAPLGPITIDWIVVGGGGGGGWKGQNVDWYGGGGGGAGAVVTGSTTLTNEFSITLDVAPGGAGADEFGTENNGGAGVSIYWPENLEILDFIALGGGRGGNGNDINPGGTAYPGDGGSGGGGASLWSSTGTLIFNTTGGTSVQFGDFGYGFGQAGCNGGTSFATKRGGSGGSGEPTSNPNCPFPDSGYVWLDGNIYAIGGSSDTTDVPPAGRGNGGNCNQDGRPGVAVIRYAGTIPRATGGTITTAGGYTYHTFDYTGEDQFFENL
jgi:hypothetical protein